MRVITGIARGRKLRSPDGYDVRPTTEITKEALFSILQFELEGARVLDLFAGSGQLGIEALSRGADSAPLWIRHGLPRIWCGRTSLPPAWVPMPG